VVSGRRENHVQAVKLLVTGGEWGDVLPRGKGNQRKRGMAIYRQTVKVQSRRKKYPKGKKGKDGVIVW